MKIAILSRNSKLYSTSRLVEAAQQRGHEVSVINPLRCYMNITANHPDIHYRGQSLSDVDAVIPRIGASITFYGTAVVRQFEMMGVFCLNESVAISSSRDKLHCLQLLARKGVGMPMTSFAHSPDDTEDLIALVGGAPLVLKLLEGTQGKGVVLVETEQAAKSVIDAFRDLDVYFLAQEFIKEAQGMDIRCLVIGDKVVAAMSRQAQEGEFRSNLHRGGTACQVRITPEERAMAVKAAKIVGLNVAGVDMMRTNKGAAVLEVNSSPGLEGIEKSTRLDIAGLLIEYMEKVFASRQQRLQKSRLRPKTE
ncbi:MAG: 30S ribosomal protein S6--L-glutamate ligase [Thiotrichaceae bacterium]|nr:30S ribosomal protein S6--L-glutamate ligase [Thiotrichaceae bacterium]